jgi:hypothetical protein
VLWVVDVDAAADGGGDGRQIAFVGADDEVAAAQGAFDDAGVDDVGGAGAAGQGSGGPGPGVVESFGSASGQEPGELRLALCRSVTARPVRAKARPSRPG